MKRWLLALYPRAWLDQYGEEYAALLEDTDVSFAVVLDVIKSAGLLRIRAHAKMTGVLVGSSLSVLSSLTCMKLGLTANILVWAPTNIARALGLIATLAPLLYVACSWPKPFHELLQGKPSKLRTGIMVLLNVAAAAALTFWLCLLLTVVTGIAGYITGSQSLFAPQDVSFDTLFAQVFFSVLLLAVGIGVLKGIMRLQKHLLQV